MHNSSNSPAELLSDYSALTIIIPTLNEAKTIRLLLEQLERLYSGVSIIVADDGSSDGTQEDVRRFARTAQKAKIELLDRSEAESAGLCASVLDAIERCHTEYFVVMDGDFQHPPEFVQELALALANGSKFAAGARQDPGLGLSWPRLLITKTSTFLARYFLKRHGTDVQDPLSGFFGGHTPVVQECIRQKRDRFEPGGYKILFDLLKLLEQRIRVTTVFYRFDERSSGYSKLRLQHGILFLRSFFR